VVRVWAVLQTWRESTQNYTHDMAASPSAIFVTFRNDSLNLLVNCVVEPWISNMFEYTKLQMNNKNQLQKLMHDHYKNDIKYEIPIFNVTWSRQRHTK
jgi:hypothetical protein